MKIELAKTTIELTDVSFDDAWKLKSAFMKNMSPETSHGIKLLKDDELSKALFSLTLQVDSDVNLMETIKMIIVKYSKKINNDLMPEINKQRVVESYMKEKDFQRDFGALVSSLIQEVASPFFSNHQSLLPLVQVMMVGQEK